MNQINETELKSKMRSRLKVKIYVLLMTCLAGSIICMTVDIVGIRHFKLVHYSMMIYVIAGAALAWSIWPKRLKDNVQVDERSINVHRDLLGDWRWKKMDF